MAKLIFSSDDLRRDYRRLLTEVARAPGVNPRGLHTREVRPLVIELTDPQRCIVKRKGFSRSLMWMEIAQLLAGEYDHGLYRAVSPQAAQHITPYGAYGPRIREQLLEVERELRRDPDSRRAVVYVGRPDDLRYAAAYGDANVVDMPCTESWQFFNRNGALDMLVTMRSWDLVWGLSYDIPAFVSVQLALADALHLKPGAYTHVAGSGHLYERDVCMIEEVIEAETTSQMLSINPNKLSMGTVQRGAVIVLENARRLFGANMFDVTLEGWEPAFTAWLKRKRGT